MKNHGVIFDDCVKKKPPHFQHICSLISEFVNKDE